MRARRRLGTSLRIVVAGAAALALPLTVAIAAPATSEPVGTTLQPDGGSEGIESEVAELTVDQGPETLGTQAAPDDPFEQAGVPEGAGTVVATSGQTSGLAVVGVTWAHGTAPEGASVVMRSRTADAWSEWALLEQEDVVSEDPGADDLGSAATEVRDGTEPAFVGAVDEVEVAVRGAGDALPQDIRLVLIEPGEADAEPTVANASFVEDPDAVPAPAIVDESASGVSTGTSDAFTTAAVARPAINTRAQWGADESIMTWTPQVGRVNGAVVHHTAGSNNYTAAQVPSIIRGIYTYHAQSRGWGDIGYNFLVDKFGRIWEGRAGGVERAIVGAHAAGVNSHTFGLSLMGNYDQASVPAAAMDAMSRLLAWKLSLHGVRANGTASIDGRTLPAVVGHRDVGQTACPGANLYPRLGELRSRAANLQPSPLRGPLVRDLTGDGFPELLAENGGIVSLVTAGRTWSASTRYGPGWNDGRVFSPGDFDGNGRGDLMLIDRTGRLYFYGSSGSGWQPRRFIGSGWSVMDAVVGGHDWDGDGRPDLLARRSSDGSLWLYSNSGAGGFRGSRQIGWAWQQMSAITLMGDLRDGRPSLVAQEPDGRLVTYVGDGRGNFAVSRPQGTGWNTMTSVLGPGDATGDGAFDLVARDGAGRLLLYPGNGDGSFRSPVQIGQDWQQFSTVSVTRSGETIEFYPVSGSGVLHRYPYVRSGQLTSSFSTSVRAARGSDVIVPGDWDGDGRPDLVVRDRAGSLFLHRGTGTGTFSSTGNQIGRGWEGMRDIVGAPGFGADGEPGILALEASTGRIWLYPGTAHGAFKSRVLIGSGAARADMIVSVGTWTGGSHDLVTREGGDLILRKGNGAGQLGPAQQIGWGWGGASAIVGVGDATSDGVPDLVFVDAGGSVRLYPGNGKGGFLAARPFGQVSSGAVVF